MMDMNLSKFWELVMDSINWRERKLSRTSLVAQCVRICLPMQRKWVRFLVREESTCLGATKPGRHWAHLTEPTVPRACALQHEKPPH